MQLIFLSPIGITIFCFAAAVAVLCLSHKGLPGIAISSSILISLSVFWIAVFYVNSSSSIHGRSWLSSRCYISSTGWTALRLVSIDSGKEAELAASRGDKRFMFAYDPIPGRQPNRDTTFSTRVSGLDCKSEVEVKPPYGEPVYGDALPTCSTYFTDLQVCKSQQYNHTIFRLWSNESKSGSCKLSYRIRC